VLSLVLAAALVASITAFVPAANAATRAQRVAKAFDVVRAQKGDPYRYGASGPNAFDCSGLIYYSYRRAGINVPRTSGALAQHADRIRRRNLDRGDLVFFYGSGGVYHVAMFLRWKDGERIILHSPSSGKSVNRDPIWTSSWFAGTKRIRG
jgi:cell wall-associated NlpC family hydrolase